MGRIRLSEADREKYPGGDADGWMDFDVEQLTRQDAGWLEEFEETVDLSVHEFLQGLEKGRTRCVRALVWAARKLNGCDDKWADFRPQILLIEQEDVFGDDADPPEPGNRAERRAAAKAPRGSGRARRSGS